MARRKEDDNQSKQRLLETALRMFALCGYEGASTRSIAAEAGVNISAITYYFNSKEGLYHAVIDHISDMMKRGIADNAQKLEIALENEDITFEECQNLLHQFLRNTMNFMLSDRASPYAICILVREQAEPTEVFDIFHAIMCTVQDVTHKLISKLTGLEMGSEELILCTHSIKGQIIVFRTHREILLRATGWKTIDQDALNKIADIIIPQIDAIISYYRQRGGMNL